MAIKLITFKTNHTLLGDLTESSKDTFVMIKQPVQVVSVPPRAADDPGSIAFSPYLEYSQDFRSTLDGTINPYGEGDASNAVVKVLKNVKLTGMVQKTFYDL